MTKHDFDAFSALMQGMAECYGQTMSAQGIALRFRLLEKYDLADVEKASMTIMTTRKYTTMPTPADFIENLSGGCVDDIAEIEADKVLRAIGDCGAYNSVVFDNGTTQAVIANAYGGWPKLCSECGEVETTRWFRKNFAKTWSAYARQGITLMGHLPGITEISNASNGFADLICPPRIVGDRAKARAIMEAKRNLPKIEPKATGPQPVAALVQ